MSADWQDEEFSGPSLDDVTRYFTRAMAAPESRIFERHLASSEEFAARAMAMWELIEPLESVQAQVDPDAAHRILLHERGLWWRKRLQEAAARMADERRQLGRLAQSGVAAALELTLDVPRRLARLLVDPVQAVLAPGAAVSFVAAAPHHIAQPIRTRGAGPAAAAPPQQCSGTLIAESLPRARVVVDPQARTLLVSFQDGPIPDALVLVPGDPDAEIRVGVIVSTATGPLATFVDLPDGEYLLIEPAVP